MKIEIVESAVLKYYPELSLKINKGDRHRIMKKDWKGSIWITRRGQGYRIHITGNAEKYLSKDLERRHGKCNGYDLDYPYWYLNNASDVQEIIGIYASKKISVDFTKKEFVSIAKNNLTNQLNNISETERETLINSRVGQNVLRELIMEIYNCSCAMCDINDARLLRASHIVQWSKDKDNRLNPTNVLCLCGLHDLAFENGIITISDNNEILINSASEEVLSLLKKITTKELKLPNNKNFFPDKKLLRVHRVKK